MKQFSRISLVLIAFFVFASSAVHADTISSSAVSVTASVDGTASLNIQFFKNDISGANSGPATSFDFGQLQEVSGTLRSSNSGTNAVAAAYLAYITANTHGNDYTITQTGTQVKSGSNQLPDNALAMNVVYVASDNGNVTDGTLGSKDTWVGTKTLYTSTSTGPMRTVRAYYSVTPDPAVGPGGTVPLDQAAGSYSGTVTYTLTY